MPIVLPWWCARTRLWAHHAHITTTYTCVLISEVIKTRALVRRHDEHLICSHAKAMVICLKWITIDVRKNSKLYCFAHPVLGDALALSSLASVPRVYHGDGEGDGEGSEVPRRSGPRCGP